MNAKTDPNIPENDQSPSDEGDLECSKLLGKGGGCAYPSIPSRDLTLDQWEAMHSEALELDWLMADGCWHGFRVASKCPNEGCVEAMVYRKMISA